MFERMKDWVSDYLYDHEGILSVFIAIGLIALILGLVFGGYCVIGWILMLMYNALRGTFGWPELSFWIFVGAAFVITLLKPSVRVRNND